MCEIYLELASTVSTDGSFDCDDCSVVGVMKWCMFVFDWI